MKKIFKAIKNFFKKLFSRKKKIFYLANSITLPEKLSAEEEEKILDFLRNGDESVKPKLIEHNLRLVVYIAQKFEKTGVPMEDLVSIGTIGLIKAVNSFDANKNIKIATYASRCIENEILMHLRKAVKIKQEVSLDNPLNVDSDGNELLLSDVIGTEPDMLFKGYEDYIEKKQLREAVDALSKREKNIMQMRFGLFEKNEMTQKEVANELNISQSYISRLEKKILSRLKIDLEKKDIDVMI